MTDDKIEEKFRELIMSNMDQIVVTERDRDSVYGQYNHYYFRLQKRLYKIGGSDHDPYVYYNGAVIFRDRKKVLWDHIERTWYKQKQATAERETAAAFAEVFGPKMPFWRSPWTWFSAGVGGWVIFWIITLVQVSAA